MKKHTILFLAANPSGIDRLALDREARAIQAELERSGLRDRFEFETRWAVEPLDLLRELRKLKPTVVHFSGHGVAGKHQPGWGLRRDVVGDLDLDGDEQQYGLFFQSSEGRAQFVSAAALEQTFGAAGSSVKLVVLNACYSEVQAEALLAHVDCVVGMGGSIHDDAARSFAIGFYGGLGEHESVATAFRQGQAAISLMGLPGSDRPQLRVRSEVDADRLVFAAGSRYLAVPAAAEELWHRLCQTVPPEHVSKIAEQPWREVQPHLEEVVCDRITAKRVAFASEGGVGKSFLLAALHIEQIGTRVWVDAVAPLHDLEAALAFGAWATQRTGAEMTVFVDAIDQVPDPVALLGTIERALATCDRTTVYIGVRFATWAEIRERLPRWRGVRLVRWADERIRRLVRAGRSEPLSPDLVDLLRTPLLLDLFLRTFTTSDTIPLGLATRHGILRAYFQGRVLPDDDARATERREVLDAGVAAVLANSIVWRNASTAATQLTSEGVITRTSGELRFRHALLRDYAAALHLAPQTADQIARALHGVRSPIVRNELLRGIIEALLDPGPAPIVGGASVEDVIRECTRNDLAPGIALGITDAPTSVLLESIAPLDNGAVLRQALVHAHLIDNRAWLRVPVGNMCPVWFGKTQLEAMASLAEFAVATGDAASTSLATTLRAWTWGYRAGSAEAWAIATIGQLLARTLLDDTTVGWYESLEFSENPFLSLILEQLRDLGANQRLEEAGLSRALHKIVFGPGALVLQGGHPLWEVIHICLRDYDDNKGFLTTRPVLALSLLFALSVARELEEQRRRRSIRAAPVLAEMFAKLPPPPPDYTEAEARLRVEPSLTMEEAIGEFVDDAPVTESTPLDYVETLIEEVAQQATEDIAFAEVLATVSVASRSVHARIITLGLRGSARLDEIALEILHDCRMYHIYHASHALWDAIHVRWPSFSSDTRVKVQSNILSRARSPLLSFTSVGRLASAVPREDLVPALVPYLEFLEATGRSMTPPRPTRGEAFSGDMNDDAQAASESQQPETGLRRLEELVGHENDSKAVDQSIVILREEISGLNFRTPDWAWFAVARAISSDEKRTERAFQAEEARALFEVALGAASHETRRQEAESWATLLDIADVCPSYVADNEAADMRKQLIAEVVSGAGEHAERPDYAWRAFICVRPIAWFDERTGGRTVFESWFRDYLHGDALKAGLRFLRFLPDQARLPLVRHVLETADRLKASGEGLAFVNEAGRLMAAWSIWWEQEWARELVRSWCEAIERPGVLATPVAWRSFISGFAWSLQNEVRRVTPEPQAEPVLRRFAPLLSLAWSAWSRIVDDADRNTTVGWSVTAPLARRFTTQVIPPDGSWSANLRTLVPRVISEGSRNDISAFQQVDWSSMDSEMLMLLTDAAIERADREITSRPPTDWMFDGLIKVLGEAGTLAALPLTHAHRVLDCLQRLARSVPRAMNPAFVVERTLQSRDAQRNA